MRPVQLVLIVLVVVIAGRRCCPGRCRRSSASCGGCGGGGGCSTCARGATSRLRIRLLRDPLVVGGGIERHPADALERHLHPGRDVGPARSTMPCGCRIGVPGRPGQETHHDPRRNAQGPQHQRHRGRELFLVADHLGVAEQSGQPVKAVPGGRRLLAFGAVAQKSLVGQPLLRAR